MSSKLPSLYYTIAIDLAQRITHGEFPEGAKISGRTLLASHYQVSPETIRKAVGILKEADVVGVSRGKEIEVNSRKKAEIFLNTWNASQPAQLFWDEFDAVIAEKKKIDQKFYQLLEEVTNRSPRISALAPYRPFEIQIPSTSPAIGHTIGSLQIRQKTGATIVALRKDSDLMISPGPEIVLQAKDWLVLVGPEESIPKLYEIVNN